MKPRRRLERLEAAAAAKRRAKTLPVSIVWRDDAGNVLPTEPGVRLHLDADQGGERLPAPGWLSDEGTLTLGEQSAPKPRKRKGPPPSPEPGSREWYIATGLHVGSHFIEQALGNPSLTIDLGHRPKPRAAINVGFIPGAQWRRSAEAGMR